MTNYLNIATDTNVFKERNMLLEEKNDLDFILDLKKFPGYIYLESIKRPCHR